MKYLKRFAAALLAGVMALCLLAGCSSEEIAAAAQMPMPSDPDAKAVYQDVVVACQEKNHKVLTYSEELSTEVAQVYLDNYVHLQNKEIKQTEHDNNRKTIRAAIKQKDDWKTLKNPTVVYSESYDPYMTMDKMRPISSIGPVAADNQKMLDAFSSIRANYVGIAVKAGADGTKYMVIVYAHAD